MRHGLRPEEVFASADAEWTDSKWNLIQFHQLAGQDVSAVEQVQPVDVACFIRVEATVNLLAYRTGCSGWAFSFKFPMPSRNEHFPRIRDVSNLCCVARLCAAVQAALERIQGKCLLVRCGKGQVG